MNTNNGVKWRRFIVPKKCEEINDYLFIDTYIDLKPCNNPHFALKTLSNQNQHV